MTLKKNNSLIIFILSVALSLIACGCGYDETADKSVKVTVVDSPQFTLAGEDRVIGINREGTASFRVKTEPPYFVKGVDYKDAEVKDLGSGTVEITLKNVKYSARVRVICGVAAQSVTYDFNGGTCPDGRTERTLMYELKNHAFSNALNGAGLTRDGYVFTGWNTLREGGGEHINGGSRLRTKQSSLTLYAEWAKETDQDRFSYELWKGEATVTGFSQDSGESIVLPRFLGGAPVTAIKSGAFKSCSQKTLVLPDTLLTVEDGAFQSCYFESLYMSDSLGRISDGSFFNCRNLSALFINAVQPPRYMTFDRHSVMTDKYDILIESAKEKKIAVFGGSGAYFSVDTKRIEAAFPGYKAINLAVNAHYNAQAQLDMILPFMGEGDVFVHLPEAASEYQFMQRSDMDDSRLLMSLESNYGLFSSVDLRNITGVFDSFTEFNEERKDRRAQSYDDGIDYIDDRGNYSRPKPPFGKDETISEEANIKMQFLHNGAAIDDMKKYYERLEQKGAVVLVGNAAVNRQGLELQLGDVDRNVRTYDRTFATVFGSRAFFPLGECVYDGSAFYNSDYHLSDSAAKTHTDKIIERLKDRIQPK